MLRSQAINRKLYIGVMDADELEYLSVVDVRRLESKEKVETYIGIQKASFHFKKNEIGQYVNLVDATFPLKCNYITFL